MEAVFQVAGEVGDLLDEFVGGLASHRKRHPLPHRDLHRSGETGRVVGHR
jgi:hypothetical protein